MPLKVSGSLASLMGFSAFGIGRIEPTNIRNTIDSIEATAAASCTAAATWAKVFEGTEKKKLSNNIIPSHPIPRTPYVNGPKYL